MQRAAHAAGEAVRRAREHGVGLVGVRNSNHFGMAAHFTRMIAEQGCVGLATTNGSPAMAPWGGKEKAAGANPWSIAVGRPARGDGDGHRQRQRAAWARSTPPGSGRDHPRGLGPGRRGAVHHRPGGRHRGRDPAHAAATGLRHLLQGDGRAQGQHAARSPPGSAAPSRPSGAAAAATWSWPSTSPPWPTSCLRRADGAADRRDEGGPLAVGLTRSSTRASWRTGRGPGWSATASSCRTRPLRPWSGWPPRPG